MLQISLLIRKMGKRVAVATIALVMSVSAFAQERGDIAIGVNTLGGLYSEKTYSYGIGAKFLYNITAPIRVAGEFDYSVGTKKDASLVSYYFKDLSLYAHYLFPLDSYTVLYPLVGVGLFGIKTEATIFGTTYSASESRTAFAVGGGFEYAVTSHLIVNGELRLKLHGGNHFIYLVGLSYIF